MEGGYGADRHSQKQRGLLSVLSVRESQHEDEEEPARAARAAT